MEPTESRDIGIEDLLPSTQIEVDLEGKKEVCTVYVEPPGPRGYRDRTFGYSLEGNSDISLFHIQSTREKPKQLQLHTSDLLKYLIEEGEELNQLQLQDTDFLKYLIEEGEKLKKTLNEWGEGLLITDTQRYITTTITDEENRKIEKKYLMTYLPKMPFYNIANPYANQIKRLKGRGY